MSKHIFISHSKKDSNFINKLEGDLEQLGFKIWIDTDISGGEEWRNTIDKNLRTASDVVVVLSPNAVASKWVVHETAIAIGAGINVVPIMIKEIPEKDIPVFAEEKQWIDFQGWGEDDKYKSALAKLTKAITPPNPIQDLLEQSVQAYLQTGELLGDSLLGYIEENLNKVNLNETAAILLDKSRQRRNQAQRIKIRNQRLLQGGVVVLSILTIVAILLSLFSFNQTNNLRSSEATSEARALEAEEARALEQEQRILADEARIQAEEQASLAIAGELAANASSLSNTDPELGMLLAIHSLGETYTVQGEEVLRQLLLTSKIRTLISPHQGQQVNVATFSPDGKYILTTGSDSVARIWDADTGQLYQELLGHTAPITHGAFSKGGQLVITISEDQTIRTWDAFSGKDEFVFDASPASFSSDGKFFIGVVPEDNAIQIWEVDTYELVQSFENTEQIIEVKISPEGKYAIITNSEYISTIMDISTGQQVGFLPGDIVAFSGDGNYTFTGVPTLNLWDLSSGEILHNMWTDVYLYDLGAAFSPDGKWLVTWPIDMLNWNKMAQIWDVNSGQLVKTLRGHGGDVISAAFDPTSQYLVTGSVDNSIRVWNIYTGEILFVLLGHTEKVTGVSFSPDGSKIVSASIDGTVRTWDISTNISQIVGDATKAIFGPRDILTFASEDGVVTVNSFKSGQIKELHSYQNASTHDGKWVFQILDDSTILISEALTGEVFRQIGPVEGEITNIFISPNGEYLIVNNQVWSLESGAHVSDLSTIGGNLAIIGGTGLFSPDNESVVLPESDFSLRVWELATGKGSIQMSGHTNDITNIVFSPDGELVATTSLDGTARVWDVESGQPLFIYDNPLVVHIFSADFSPDSKNILITDWNGKVQLFEARTGTLVKNFIGHDGVITSAKFNPDGKFILTASGDFATADNSTRIWETNTGQQLYELDGSFYGINNVSFSQDGRWAVVVDNKGKVHLIFCEVCNPYQELIHIAEKRLAILGRNLSCQEEQKYLHNDIQCVMPIPTPNP